MPVREIRLFGDPILKTPSEPITEITDSIRSLILDLEATTALTGRAGVAANQIGVNLRAFGYQVGGVIGHLINPEIVEVVGDKVEINEGCLSLPGIWSQTPRYPKVVVRGQNLDQGLVDIEAEGLLAQVFQHEIDHLDGMLYLDRLGDAARKVCMASLRDTTWFMRN